MIICQTKFVQGTQEWLNHRKNIITATDVSTILGINPFADYYDLILNKWSINQSNNPSPAMEWGSYCESVARDYFKIKFNIQVMEANLIIHPEYGWLGASPDGIIKEEDALLEIKCPFSKMYDRIPDHYYSQMQIQMEVLKAKKCYFWVCLMKKGNEENALYYDKDKNVSIMEFKREIVYYKPQFFKNYFDEIYGFYKRFINNDKTVRIKNYIESNLKTPIIKNRFDFKELLGINEGEEVQSWLEYKQSLRNDNEKAEYERTPTSVYFENKRKLIKTKFISQFRILNPDFQTVYFDKKMEKIMLDLLLYSNKPILFLKPEFYMNDIILKVDVSYRNYNNEYELVWFSTVNNLETEVKKEKWLLKVCFIEMAIEKLCLPTPNFFNFYLFNGEQKQILFNNPDEKEKYRNKVLFLLNRWDEIKDMPNTDFCQMNMNYKQIKPQFKEIHYDLAYRRGEPTLLWSISNKRKTELKKEEKIKSFWSPKFGVSKTIQKEKKRAPIIIRMVENEKNPFIPKRKSHRIQLLKKKSTVKSSPRILENRIVHKAYVDFETITDDNKTYIFQIGVGFMDNKEWFYKSFISLQNPKQNERNLVKRFLKWVNESEVRQLIHWSSAEPVIYNKVKERYGLINLDDKWVDLLPIFREKYLNLEVKGLFSFSLKDVANTLSLYGLIQSNYLGCKIQGGFDAMIEAQNYFKKNNGKYRFKKDEFRKEIEEYNELDVKILSEIDFLI